MKLTCMMLLCMFMEVSAATYAQKISLTVTNAPIEQVLKQIRKLSGYNFIYEGAILNKSRPVNINVVEESLDDVLQKCFKEQPFDYLIDKKTIVIKLKQVLVSNDNNKQILHIKGSVFDEANQPLPGVTVKIKSNGKGTVTDPNGRYSIDVPSSADVLVFSFIGFIPQEVTVGNREIINITLNPKSSALEEVVVIGYGTQKAKDLTGSVGSVNIEDINKANTVSFDQALAGRVAGVSVVSQDGQPGAPVNIVIRGNSSLTQDNSPLYVVDGFPIENFNNNLLNPNEIESITVLKDASSTAIYGARGAQGVIIITTKRGKTGDPVVGYNAYFGVQNRIKKIPLLTPYQFLQKELEDPTTALPALPGTATYNNFAALYLTPLNRNIDDYKNLPGVDFQDGINHVNALSYSHYVSLYGGTDKTRYSVTGSITQQDGIIIAGNYKRYQGRMSIDQTIRDNLKAGFTADYSSVLQKGTPPGVNVGIPQSNFLYQAWTFRPITGNGLEEVLVDATYDPSTGPSTSTAINYNVNPIASALNELRNNTTNNIYANAYINYQILPKLTIRITGGLNNSNLKQEVFNNEFTQSGGPRSPFKAGVNGSVNLSQVTNYLNENTVTYANSFNNVHNVNFLAGITEQVNNTGGYAYSANHLPTGVLGLQGLYAGAPTSISSPASIWTLASFLGRANYNYNSRYFFTATLRADGSSKFSKSNKYSYFPSGAIAWDAANERFIKSLKFISQAKLRASYGLTGNNRVADFAYLPQFAYFIDGTYPFNNNLANVGAYRSAVGNPDLKWETTAQTDLGADLSFFNQRLSLTTDLYRKVTSDLLLQATLPGSTGFGSALKNIGKVQNDGLELTISTTNIATASFQWTTNFNISFNRSKVLALTQGQDALTTNARFENNTYNNLPNYIAQIGQPISTFYGLVADGLYQYGDFNVLPNGKYVLKNEIPTNGNSRANIQPGDFKFKDINGDGVIDTKDYTVIGRAEPVHTGGFTNNFTYKGFDLNVFFQWSYGNDILNANRLLLEENFTGGNQYATYANRWTPTNLNTDIARKGGGSDPTPLQFTSRVIEDGSYIRLKTIQLGYNIPVKLLQRIKVKSARITLSGQNIYTWTGYSGIDPEVSVRNTALNQGFDFAPYPRARVFTAGLNASF